MSLIENIQINSLSEACEILKGIGVDDNLFEKAHKDGDLHPNGKWVWVSSAAGGKGDWRTLNGRTHKKHQASSAASSATTANSGSSGTENNDGGKVGDKKSDTVHSTTNASKKAVNKQKFTTKDYEHWGHASTAKSYGLFNTDTNLASIVTKDKVNSGFIVTIKKQKNKYADGSIVETKIFSSRKQAMEYGIQKIQEKVAKDKEAVNKSFDIKQIGDFISSIKTTHGDVSFISKNGAICLGKRRDYIGECDKEEKLIELGQNDLSNVKRDREAIKEISSALKEKFGFVRKITYEDNPRLGLKKAYMKIVLKPSE